MTKLFLLALTMCCALLAACDNGENGDPKEITLSESTQTMQIIYADQTTGKTDGIKFTTTGPWTAEVKETVVTKASESTINWLRLSQYSGDKAGDYTLILTLEENFTGADRKATIKIVCGGTVITITVEQKGKKEDGTTPEVPVTPTKDRLVQTLSYTREYSLHGEGTTYRTDVVFTYDDQNRVIKAVETDYDKAGNGEPDYETTWVYAGNTITEQQKAEEEEDYLNESKIVYTLKDNRIASYIAEDYEKQSSHNYYWKQSGTLNYNEQGYLATIDIISETKSGDNKPVTTKITEYCEWATGNLAKVHQSDPSANDYASVMEYGKVENKTNLDLNYLLPRSEWLYTMAFGGLGCKPFGFIGKRSTNLMTKETDLHYKNYTTWEYELDNEGYVKHITMKEYDRDGILNTKRIYTLTYKE